MLWQNYISFKESKFIQQYLGEGWKYFWKTQKCYKHFSEGKTWPEARKFCQDNFDGNLASIPDVATLQFMRKVADSRLIDQGVLVGGVRQNGEWQWSDGTRWEWQGDEIWKSGQPQNDADHIYVRMNNTYQFYSYATFSSWFICQKKNIQEYHEYDIFDSYLKIYINELGWLQNEIPRMGP